MSTTRRWLTLAALVALAALALACDDNGAAPEATPDPISATPPRPTATTSPLRHRTAVPDRPQRGAWLLDVRTGILHDIYDDDSRWGARFAGGGESVIAMGSDGFARLDRSGDLLGETEGGLPADSADGSVMGYLDDGTLVVERAGVRLFEMDVARPYGPPVPSPDGQRAVAWELVQAGDGDRSWILALHLIDLGSGEVTEVGRGTGTGGHGPGLPRWSPSGRYLVAHEVEMGDGRTGTLVDADRKAVIEMPDWWLYAWSPVEDVLLRSHRDEPLTELYDVAAGTSLVIEDRPPLTRVRFDATGRYAYWNTDGHTVVADVTTGEIVERWPGWFGDQPGAVVSSPGGIAAVVHGGQAAGTRCLGILVVRTGIGEECLRHAESASLSPTGGRIAYVETRAGVHEVYVDGQFAGSAGPEDGWGSPELRWSPDGNYLLVYWPSDPGPSFLPMTEHLP